MNGLVRIVDGEARADSREVATSFGKRHADVLRAVDRLLKACPLELERNFAFELDEAATGQGGRRRVRYFMMTRDGFSLLVMGFTGPKALEWKLAYIDAFNRMEAALRASNDVEPPAPEAPTIGDHEHWRMPLQFVREARILGGRTAGRRAWKLVGLPDVFDDTVEPVLALGTVDAGVRGWISERLEPDQRGRVRTILLYDDYTAWCANRGVEAVSIKRFSVGLTRAGIGSFQSNVMYRIGVKLRDD